MGEDYQKNNLIFCKENGEPIYPDRFYETHIELIKQAGLGHVRFHDLRHSVASAPIDRGFSLKDIAELLGHSSIQVTLDIYGHLQDKRKKAATDALSSLLPSGTEKK
ncbi:tyrosine-type recombinase/integrase [Bacillota bacterium LX-D]|nr:tyrosine-type recombinase/integrase [Bacillota bacterium LX-D]